MSTHTDNAESISRWASLGLTLSKDLAEKIAIYEAAKYTEVSYPVRFDLDSLRVDNAEEMIRDYAEQLAFSTGQGEGGSGHSLLERAKREAVDLAARQAVGAAREFIPEAIEQLTPGFEGAAEQLVESVDRLPRDITSDSLLAGGSAVVDAYGLARSAAERIDSISLWVAQTGALSGIPAKAQEVVLRLLEPRDVGQLHQLDAAHQLNANPAVSAIGALYLVAARIGGVGIFQIHTLSEATQLRRQLTRPQGAPVLSAR
jgi:hypothetical protein